MKPGALTIATSLLVLTACQSGPEFARIGDLKPETVKQPVPAVRFDIDRQQVIARYRELLEIENSVSNSNGHGVQRLADLELELSMDQRASDDPMTAKLGVQQTRNAIDRYQEYLQDHPGRNGNDLILYQLSRAYAIEGELEQSMRMMDRLKVEHPDSQYLDEVQFRRGEILFVDGRYADAEQAYQVVVERYPDSILFEKALYKSGWSRFKQNRLDEANRSFIELLDVYFTQAKIERQRLPLDLQRADRELVEDVLRVTSLAFSYGQHKQPLARFFGRYGSRQYEPLLYQRLADLHLSKQRFSDAAETLMDYARQYPDSDLTPGFHNQAIAIYQQQGFSDLVLTEKQYFIQRYNKGTNYWLSQDTQTRQQLQPILTSHLFDTATHFHALARSSKKLADFRAAADWYRRYLDSFPNDERAAEINFLLAESSNDAGRYQEAIREFEKTAYKYPAHRNSAEAGYAALVAYRALYRSTKESTKAAINDAMIESSLRFASSFPDDPRIDEILLTTAEQYFSSNSHQQADAVAIQLLENPETSKPIRQRSWVIAAFSRFEMQQYDRAEEAYVQAIAVLQPGDHKQRRQLREQLAASIYLQGERARAAGASLEAAGHFIRVGQAVPTSDKRIVAQYDAATEYLKSEHWRKAISLLEGFRREYPSQKKWHLGVSEKLALAYSRTDQPGRAAQELIQQVKLVPAQQQRDLLYQAADLYKQAGQSAKAITVYKSYVRKYPRPISRSMELQLAIAESYVPTGETSKRHYWLRQIIKTDASAGKERSDRSRYLAASASLELAASVHQSFRSTRLTIPLKRSLKRKKDLMKKSIDAYSRAARYQVEEVTTASTYNIAEIYRRFARDLLESERPKNLNEEELEEYTYLLEDQAFPFEEKAIDIHESNVARIPAGSYDESIRSSLESLAKMMPFRYAKSEISEAYVE